MEKFAVNMPRGSTMQPGYMRWMAQEEKGYTLLVQMDLIILFCVLMINGYIIIVMMTKVRGI